MRVGRSPTMMSGFVASASFAFLGFFGLVFGFISLGI